MFLGRFVLCISTLISGNPLILLHLNYVVEFLIFSRNILPYNLFSTKRLFLCRNLKQAT